MNLQYKNPSVILTSIALLLRDIAGIGSAPIEGAMVMYTDADTHTAELKKLYDQIHKNDAPPTNESEEQAALVLNTMQAMLMLMVQNHVDSNVLELSLFYLIGNYNFR